ncbi:MAG TPA: hypothetical protein VN736_08595 [Candidatus Limnocylindrales bacterium]|nr:hypothetical protein [Candidatus Limnocylindrales bacterium]
MPEGAMKAGVYKLLLDINANFHGVNVALTALRKHKGFDRSEIDNLAELSHEARAAVNSYLTGVIETQETAEAGRRFSKRVRRERRAEQA